MNKQIRQHLIVFLSFIAISFMYFPDLLSGKGLKQGDIVQHRGAAQSRVEHIEKYGEEPLWADNLFSGMPTAFIGESTGFANLTKLIVYPLGKLITYPFVGFIIAMLCFYYLLYCMGVRSWLAAIGAFAYAFATYNVIIVEAGHNSKFLTLAYCPLVLAGFLEVIKNNRIWIGLGVFGVGLSLNLASGHPQITYYLSMVLVILGVFCLYEVVKRRELGSFIKKAVLLIAVAALALLSNTDRLWNQYEHTQYSIRGEQILTPKSIEETAGMNKDYITSWSYGKMETLNLLIPNLKGGSSQGSVPTSSETYKLIRNAKGKRVADQMSKQMPTYWGDQPFTSGPMYIGAMIIFIFVFGLFFVKGILKWGIVTAIILSIMLAWGRHFMWLSDLFIDYIPLYNKFRAPSTLLVIPALLAPFIGILGLQNFLDTAKGDKRELTKKITVALGTIGGICLLFLMIPSIAGNFVSNQDANIGALAGTLQVDRVSLLQSDAFRSLAIVAITGGILFLWAKDKITTKVLGIGLGILIIFDLWGVDKRYLNRDHFFPQKEVKVPFQKRKVDADILQDKSLNYRVLDLASNTFNSNQCAYYHQSIGGYSAAKLRRYQDMIEHHISPEIQTFANEMRTVKSNDDLKKITSKLNVLNMLNMKYVIVNENSAPIVNSTRLGHAWFVKNHQLATSHDDEIAMVGKIDPKSTAIVHEEFSSTLKPYQYDSLASIQLTDYRANRLTYKYTAATPQLVVFSEVYYPYGWYVTIDGKPAEFIRTNYITRAMIVPAGEHTIEWHFRPKAFDRGIQISYVASSLLLLLLFGGLWVERKRALLYS